MDCSIVYYSAYKTGYIQRSLEKKFRTMTNITVRSGYAAVSPKDMQMKFCRALGESSLVIIVGGLSLFGENNVMTALSDYFSKARLSVESNKRVLNENGDDGYLIKTGGKYVLVLPDDPEAAERMFGVQLLKNIDTGSSPDEIAEPVRTHTIVFAPEPNDDAAERLRSRRLSTVAVITIVLTAAVCIAAGIWILGNLS